MVKLFTISPKIASKEGLCLSGATVRLPSLIANVGLDRKVPHMIF
jgi:hypothetical protein